MLTTWIIKKLEEVKDKPRIVIRDPFQLIEPAEESIVSFADNNGYIVIASSTNLVFRELYHQAILDPEKSKIIFFDLTPIERQGKGKRLHAPPLFYPDFCDELSPEVMINVDIQQYLLDKTGEKWPDEVNKRQYTRLIRSNLRGVLDAYTNLRKADPKRFTDEDFQRIVAFAALGIGNAAFRIPEPKDYFTLALKHAEFKELNSITPQIIPTIKVALRKAEKPFCYFADHDSDDVIRGFYLILLLSQHSDQWQSIIGECDPSLRFITSIEPEKIKVIAPDLISLSPDKADIDLTDVEDSLSRELLESILFNHFCWDSIEKCYEGLQNEHYSTLLRSCGLLIALQDLLSKDYVRKNHEKLYNYFFENYVQHEKKFVDERPSESWINLRDIYHEAFLLKQAEGKLQEAVRLLKVDPTIATSEWFWGIWNNDQLNRLEYLISAVERKLNYSDKQLLPRQRERMPSQLNSMLDKIKDYTTIIKNEVQQNLAILNREFQNFIKKNYPLWVREESDVILTSSFLQRVVKPHWDPINEKAVIFIFDGMRYDIWDTLVKPHLLDYMELVTDRSGCALIPSETKISRNAISAGTFPDSFNPNEAENSLLQKALINLFQLSSQINVESPEGLGIGQTVRYHDVNNNLDVYIMDFCDNDLHHIALKDKGGKKVPARPLFDVYERIKSVIDRDVLPLMQSLDPDTKVFIVADHGFGPIGTNAIFFKDGDIADPNDCNYLNCALPTRLAATSIPDRLWLHILELKVDDIRMPKEIRFTDRRSGHTVLKKYGAYIFPRPEYAFTRPKSYFRPNAFSHGGISLQELIIPMVALKVKEQHHEPLKAEFIHESPVFHEGQDNLIIVRARHMGGEKFADNSIKATIEVRVTNEERDIEQKEPYPQQCILASRIAILSSWETQEIPIRYSPQIDAFSDQERKTGRADRTLSLVLTYQFGSRQVRRVHNTSITINLNPERIVRRVGGLGNILGLTPKGSQGNMKFD